MFLKIAEVFPYFVPEMYLYVKFKVAQRSNTEFIGMDNIQSSFSRQQYMLLALNSNIWL